MGGTYDPHESHMEMGPRHGRGARVPIAPRAVEAGSVNPPVQEPLPLSSGELPVIQDLTPRDPLEEATRGEPSMQPNGFTHNFGIPRRGPPMSLGPRGNGPVGFGGGHIGGAGGFRRSGRGTFPGENHNFDNGHRDDKTLVVEKIPEDKLTLEAVNEWFKRFGTVTNVAIDGPSGKALVSFSNHAEAHAAWKCEEAVFGNRFVKLFWHRPAEGQGGVGQRALAASAPLVRNIVQEPQSYPQSQSQPPLPQPPLQPQPQPQLSTPSTPAKPPRPDLATVAALAARQQLLEKQISEQKALMSRLATASTAEEKQDIMACIRNIQSDMKPSTTTTALPQPSTSKLSNGSSKGGLSEKERLDKELEMHSVQSALRGESQGGDHDATSTSALQDKLARLKAEVSCSRYTAPASIHSPCLFQASRLGVPESEINAEPSASPSHFRPYRGRGFRARGFTRGGTGRGGPPRTNMTLDNRPRKLLIQGVPPTDEAVQAVRNHYQVRLLLSQGRHSS